MFCDAKQVLSGVKEWCKKKSLSHIDKPTEEIISEMCDVPEDVRDLLDKLKCATGVV